MAKATKITVTAKFRPDILTGYSDVFARVVLTAVRSEAGLP